jgi:signal transduction histidine kinase
MAVAILGALAADLFVLPALVFAFARPGRRRLPRPEDPALAGGGGRRHGLMLAVLAPVIVTVLLAGLDAAQRSSRRELACWVLPNARAAPLPEVGSSCPLLPHEQVHALRLDGGAELPTGDPSAMRAALDPSVGRVELAVTRDAERQWHDVPVLEHPRGIVLATLGAAALIAMILLCMPLLLIRHSRAAAVAPFSLFYSAVATVLVCAVAGRQSAWLTRIALGALVFLPATLTHLALTFPIERRVLREAPALRWLPYLLSALFVPAAWRALERDALLWPTVIYLLLTLTGGAWIVLMASCGFAIRESTSPLERARARILLYGALILPIIPTWILAGYASTTHDTLILYLGVSTLTMPLPIGLAISRYSLFNLEVDARSLVARLLYAASAACVLAVIFTGATGALASSSPLATPPVLFATAFAGIVMLEPMRKRLLGIFESLLSPRASELVRLREELARRVIELRDQDEVARLIGSMLETALRSGGGCVFLHSPSGWRPAHAFGRSPPVKPCLASDASALLCDRTLLSLPEPNDEPTEERRRLLDAAVAVAAMLRRGGEPLGLILLQGSLTGIPYTRLDLDFVASATTHAAVALHNARLAEDLLAAERHSTTAQIALALAHDVGKELDWLRRLVERLPGRLDDEPRARRDLATIAKLTEDLAHTIGGFLRRAREPVHEGRASLSETIEQAVSAMARLHGPGRITRCVDPRLRDVSLAQSLLRVLTNLLDNALRSTAEPEPVHLFATLEDGSVRITVADRGPGMTDSVRSRAFELGFTTRASQGGSGIGLAVSREIVRTLGGILELDERPSGGTVAMVRIPLAREVR